MKVASPEIRKVVYFKELPLFVRGTDVSSYMISSFGHSFMSSSSSIHMFYQACKSLLGVIVIVGYRYITRRAHYRLKDSIRTVYVTACYAIAH